MIEIVVNRCFGGFGLSKEGVLCYGKHKGLTVFPEKNERFSSFIDYWVVPKEDRPSKVEDEDWHKLSQDERIAHNKAMSEAQLYDRDFARDDPALVKAVKELGAQANGPHAELEVVDIPDDVAWEIEEYDGREWVSEAHRTW